MDRERKKLQQVRLTIIGDEILSGRRTDKHFAHAISYFNQFGVEISAVTYIGDEQDALIDHFQCLQEQNDPVISFGGIGATVDDRTRLCMALAHDSKLIRHPEAVRLIENRFGEAAYPNRILMADLPEGSLLIPNKFNDIPGFSVGEIHCLPGFPQMAWPMMDWVIHHHYKVGEKSDISQVSFTVHDVRESEIIPLLESAQQQFPEVKLSSLPRFPSEGVWQTELGVRGSRTEREKAAAYLQKELERNGYHYTDE